MTSCSHLDYGRDKYLSELIDEAESLLLHSPKLTEEIGISDHIRSSVINHFSIFPSRYAAALSGIEVVHHMKLLSRFSPDQQYVVYCEHVSNPLKNDKDDSAVVKINILCADIPKIFNHINSVLGRLTISTIEASAISTSTGVAFDEFMSRVPVHYADNCDQLEEDVLAMLKAKPTNSTINISCDNGLEQIDTRIALSSSAPLSISSLKLVEKLGSGHMCDTYKAILIENNTAVVVKKPLTANTNEDYSQKYISLWRKELAVIQVIGHHANVCEFIGFSESNDSCESMFLCYEYLSGGCLSDVIMDKSQFFDPLRVALQVASGMRHLHDRDVLHRDLKPANVILDGKGVAKISDFGLSCQISVGSDLTAETGTYRWMAPEVIRHEHYSFPADVYSFGILLWELNARIRPFDDLTPFQAAYQVAVAHMRPLIPSHTPQRVEALLGKLWHRDAAARPTFDDICMTFKKFLRL
mmetsp:Transcript_20169/g.34001  ORF Transcript_20169/g.34001 Transcript_20169/m.34001 type:complete len:470 (-) Transcript_20169:92-1501(-)|eukprot:CAMPEP_0114430032 /NCGR_PEP_ID=MMETSP0103-20121206/9816_1 /TAXON_ID=37642 ORGANISM="Paraphysomonas imperforata, Strain PA2" /NCGR_SAMPLE_ID=MMETSP0103 /ASSEMBLY_ACC=CAM_ASM_000201 /LENGTH=469 /DNA_ID=CAMNT_0001599435 /DNA_START=95 /DNA_END=1504 /DNA_ORIENTATION=+